MVFSSGGKVNTAVLVYENKLKRIVLMYINKLNPTQNTPRTQKKRKINNELYISPPPASRAGLPGAFGVFRAIIV